MEDDPFTQQFYSYLFRRTSYEIKVTDNGDEFLTILEERPVSLIILDINLKNTYLNDEKVDGVMLSQLVKNNKKHEHIPVLLVTAYQNKMNGRDLLSESLANDYILKPITDFNDLLNKIHKLTEADGA
jgi:CheY-like chemotaxis protein